MIYFTGDTHGGYRSIIKFANRFHLLRTDVIVILGDAGYNYYGGERDAEAKLHLSHVKPTILCIHGNHEIRPTNIPTYKTREWNGGIVWYEEEYPNLLAQKVNAYIAKLIEIIPIVDNDENEWSWRIRYVGMEGILGMFESEHKHPGEKFMYIESRDGRCLKTSCGTYEYREDYLIFTTKHSVYTFQIYS